MGSLWVGLQVKRALQGESFAISRKWLSLRGHLLRGQPGPNAKASETHRRHLCSQRAAQGRKSTGFADVLDVVTREEEESKIQSGFLA